MANKGQIKTQGYYEKEEKYIKLLKESFLHGEISQDQLKNALKIVGFSVNGAAEKVKEWSSNNIQPGNENQSEMKKRLKDLASLEKYFVKNNLGKKKYDEMIKNRELKFIFS